MFFLLFYKIFAFLILTRKKSFIRKFFFLQSLRISSTDEKKISHPQVFSALLQSLLNSSTEVKISLIQKFFFAFCLLMVTQEPRRAAGCAHILQNISQLAHLGPGSNPLLWRTWGERTKMLNNVVFDMQKRSNSARDKTSYTDHCKMWGGSASLWYRNQANPNPIFEIRIRHGSRAVFSHANVQINVSYFKTFRTSVSFVI